MKKAIITALLAIALPLVSQAQRQTFNLPAFFATNVYLNDNTNLPLHLRISGSAVSNVQDWATLAAVTNINVNQFDLDNVGGIDFDTTPAGTIAAARMQWNPDMETVRLGLDAAVSLDIGQQHVAFVRNAESVTISNGTVVYISGATGDKATVKVASYSNDTLSARTIGIAAEDIVSGGTGFVVTRGPVYAQKTDTFTAGAMLYLGAYGNVTTNRPSAPLHGVFVGVVEKVNANAGVIFVAVQNGFELDELHDVNVAANTTNHLIISQGAVWTNMAIGSGLGVTGNQLVVTNVGVGSVIFSGNNMTNVGLIQGINTKGGINFQEDDNASFTGIWDALGPMTFYSNIAFGVNGYISSPVYFGRGTGTNYTSLYFWDTISQSNAVRMRVEDGDLIVTLPYGTSGLSVENGKFVGSAAGLSSFPSSILTVSAGNTNYARRTTVPASNTAFGAYNQWALDNTNLYFYNSASSKWLKVNGTLEW